MTWNPFKINREDEKKRVTDGILSSILSNNSIKFTHSEQSEILAEVVKTFYEVKREKKKSLNQSFKDLQ